MTATLITITGDRSAIMMDDCQLIPDLVEPFDELEELDKRMDGLAAQSKTGELSTADVAEAVGRLLDGLPLLQAAQKTRGWAVMVKAVQDARDEAKAETTDSLFNAGRLYTAIEDATKAITTDHDLQDVLINPANAVDREENVSAFQELAKEKLDVLVRSDSLVLNEYVASQWLDEVNGLIVGGLDSLLSDDPQFRLINGRLVIW